MSMQKTVCILISETDIPILLRAGYRLCFAKKVGTHPFNLVWRAYEEYLINSQFSWTSSYEIFGSTVFQDMEPVRVSTNQMMIGVGQKSVLDANGIFGPPSTGGPKTAITAVNEYGKIHAGLMQSSQGIDGVEAMTPIYVTEKPIAKGLTELIPVEIVLVWFEQNVETGTMFLYPPRFCPCGLQVGPAKSIGVVIDMTNTDKQTRRYEQGVWMMP